MEPIIYCADVIAFAPYSDDHYIIIERLGSVKGFALPGGKQEPGEYLQDTAYREFFEETGLYLQHARTFITCAEHKRDYRPGHYVTTVFTGCGYGRIRAEHEKTHIHLLTKETIIDLKEAFVFDHFNILMRFFETRKGYHPAP